MWHKLKLGLDVTRTLGPRWVTERGLLTIEERLGFAQRKSPLASWHQHMPPRPLPRRGGFLDIDAAAVHLRAHPATIERLHQEFEELKNRRIDVFGQRREVKSWHCDPITGAEYNPRQHWTLVSEHSDEDLKLVWEPSRFSWAFDLARLHVADPSSGAAELFWSLFEDWCEHNQPNAGVNWKCGQESSIRLMAVAFATEAFQGAGETPERSRLLAAFVDVTVKRVLAHWRYAKHQRNNHVVSEAVGLITASTLFPDLEVAAEARTLGRRLLVDSCRDLVFPDGGTSQYSLNYHRVFMHNFLWARAMLKSEGTVLAELKSALDSTGDFLAGICDLSTGDTANFGQNDGALLLPLSNSDFLDMRPTLCAAGRHDGSGASEATELARWLGVDPADANMAAPTTRHFPYMGITHLRHGNNRAIVHARNYRFRPSHADQLHVDLWIDGVHVVVDPGTWSYKPKASEPDLSPSSRHNGPLIDGQEDMSRASRFLFQHWSVAFADEAAKETDRWTCRIITHRGKHSATRTVRAIPGGWHIEDSLDSLRSEQLHTTWTLAAGSVEVLPYSLRFQAGKGEFSMKWQTDVTSTESGVTPSVSCFSYRRRRSAQVATLKSTNKTIAVQLQQIT